MADSIERDTESAAVEAKAALRPDEDTIIAMNVHQRMHGVRRLVGGNIEKGGHFRAKSQKTGAVIEYPYVTHDDVTEHVRAALNIFRINTLPTVVKWSNNGNRVEVDVNVEFINIDKPEDRAAVVSTGFGADTSDKGPGKAISYAVKYAYLKTFLLNSADDIEEHDIKHDSVETRVSVTEKEREIAVQSVRQWAEEFKTELDACKSEAEVNALQKRNRDMIMSEGVPESTRAYFVERIQARKDALAVGTP